MALGLTVSLAITTSSSNFGSMITKPVNTEINIYRQTERIGYTQTYDDQVNFSKWWNQASSRDQVKYLTGITEQDLLDGAAQYDTNGKTIAGRAIQKHGDRSWSIFPKISGENSLKNEVGQLVVDEIVNGPDASWELKIWNHEGLRDLVVDVFLPSGYGARFYEESREMIGFRER